MKSQTYLTKSKLPNNTSFIKRLLFFLPIVKFVIKEESMQPVLSPGDGILVNRLDKGKIGDIIVFKNPQKNTSLTYVIKKVVKKEKNAFYVLGINKEKSRDSRHFGWIEKKDIIGKMMTKL